LSGDDELQKWDWDWHWAAASVRDFALLAVRSARGGYQLPKNVAQIETFDYIWVS